ncbi:MAG: glucosaminidase domain-containing protein [Hyphomicrobiaceae bacterium]
MPQKYAIGLTTRFGSAVVLGAILWASAALSVMAQSLPQIRLSPRNQVPACVTPSRMQAFLADGNPRLERKFQSIASYYRLHGERMGVRWDYAFYQMIIETNYLKFKNNAGKGDVSPRQNNFAGIGTTGGGVPGDSFPDVSTGVVAQMQHLIAYSGEPVAQPVARRTREKQDDIIAQSRRLRRPVTFRDLSGRWAADRRYWRSIAFIADRFTKRYCHGREGVEEARELGQRKALLATASTGVSSAPERPRARMRQAAAGFASRASVASLGVPPPPVPARRPLPEHGGSDGTCKVFTASYGGKRNVLIRHRVGDEMRYTALQVLDGREKGLA